MSNISFLERVKTIFDLIGSQSFFLTLFVIVVFTTVMLIINYRIQSKAPRIAATIIYLGMVTLVLLKYGSYVFSLNDSVVDKVFRAVYFPNIVVYVCMLIISILLILITFIDKKFSMFAKAGNTFCFCVIWFLFVLFMDTAKRENLNFYQVTDLYSDKTIMILLQSSMFVFVTWLAIFLMDFIARKLSKNMTK